MSTILSYTDYIDWKKFIADKLGDDLHDRYLAVKAADPGSIITSHAAAVGLFTSPDHWEGQPDDWTMARQVDFYGTSFYPKHSAFVDRDVAWRGALFDFTRSFGFADGRGSGCWRKPMRGISRRNRSGPKVRHGPRLGWLRWMCRLSRRRWCCRRWCDVRGKVSSEFEVVVLVKPQFEVGRERVGKGGIVRDGDAQQMAVERVKSTVAELGGAEIEVIESPILGAEGNREFLLHARFG